MLRTTIFRSRLAGRAAMAMALLLPLAIPALAQASPSTYTVKAGDTLWEIARRQLGDPFRWREIQELNRGAIPDPNRIPVGAVLQLPGAPQAGGREQPPSPAPAPAAAPAPPPAAAPPARAPVLVVTGGPDTLPSVSVEQEGDPATALFRRRSVASAQNAFRAYRESRFHPLRAGEFFSSGFLSEGVDLPYGTLLGPVTPEQIPTAGGRAAVQQFTRVALAPPAGASYATGDSLLVIERREAPAEFGEVVVPTGLIRVMPPEQGQAVGEVVSVYGAIRQGQSLLPAPRFSDPGPLEYRRVSDGLEGRVLMERDPRELRLPHQVLFLDIGTRDGVALGDMFEARRTPGSQAHGTALTVDEPMATLQVVQVRERSATVKVLNVLSPHLPPGTRVRLVARLPG